jgi:outer membrane protein assembly factor BamB
VSKKLYVGYGDGGIAIIDAVSFKQMGDIKLQGHPESFQLDMAAKKIFVNVPDKHQVEVIDLDKKIVTARWKLTAAKSNFPMALDVPNHRLLIGCRHPSQLLVLNSTTGNVIAEQETDGDADDIFLNQKNGNIYLSCGAGYIDIFKQQDTAAYKLIDKISTRSGARTSLYISSLNRLIIAAPGHFSNSAALLVYGLNEK